MRTGTGREERKAPEQLRETTSYCPALAPIETSNPPFPFDWTTTGGAKAHNPMSVIPRVLLNSFTSLRATLRRYRTAFRRVTASDMADNLLLRSGGLQPTHAITLPKNIH